jgi:hypothetical protein
MDVLMLLIAIAFISLLTGLIWTMRIRSRIKKEVDTGVSQKVKAAPVGFNPVILSYFFFVALIFLVIWFFKLYYQVPF